MNITPLYNQPTKPNPTTNQPNQTRQQTNQTKPDNKPTKPNPTTNQPNQTRQKMMTDTYENYHGDWLLDQIFDFVQTEFVGCDSVENETLLEQVIQLATESSIVTQIDDCLLFDIHGEQRLMFFDVQTAIGCDLEEDEQRKKIASEFFDIIQSIQFSGLLN